ncbi:spore germination protein KA [Clostridium aceticum]|uniref:Spore germination protein KA n=1 Tax=Clostridium aceticum TaxID=84022 RepID=A0A0D8IAI4_9CLOT|nr:spore germination protein [Clostridium aceticum]AKL96009.1 spore germination protein KA [Clostridium aceticum]KJF27054.1 spore gernimation protein KA [Clostridium aceticum]
MSPRRKSKSKQSYPTLSDTENTESTETELTVKNLHKILGRNKDVIFRDIYINGNHTLPVTVVFVDGLVDLDQMSNYIFKPLILDPRLGLISNLKDTVQLIEDEIIYFPMKERRLKIEDVVQDILNGSTAIVFDEEKIAITYYTQGFEKRGIEEPTGENVIKGSKDAFVETLRTNTATIRRKIKSEKLVIEETIVGRQSMTDIAIVYISELTNKTIVDEVKKRLDRIDIDGIITTTYVEENIIDNHYSVFPQVLTTERPDKFCSNVLQGRVGLIIDGLPAVYIIPATFVQFLQAPEDYAQNYLISSIIRLLRYVLVLVTLVLPSFYISVTTFHHEMIPTELALSIVGSKEGVPFPTFVEVILMLIAFEILVEAGLRLPKTIGQAVSIVGALVVGQSAVEAKLVSPAVVVVIAITAIATFTMPNQDFSNALRLWRFILVIFSSIMGLFGLSMAMLLLLFHLSTLETYGIPYLSPFSGTDQKQVQDTLFRLPVQFFTKRPINLKTTNKKRQE